MSWTKTIAVGAAFVCAATALSASSAGEPPVAQPPEPVPEPDYEPAPPSEPDANLSPPRPEPDAGAVKTGIGVSLNVGGGVDGFISDKTRQVVDVGGTWEARLAVGTLLPVAIELAYVGSARDIDALGADEDALLMGSGVEAAARVNVLDAGNLQLVVVAGIGWTHYEVTNTRVNNSNLADDDHVGIIPLAVGIGYRFAGMTFDVRGAIRTAFNDQLLRVPAGTRSEPQDASTWSATARLGWEF